MASVDEADETDLGEAIDILLVEPNPGDTRLFEENFRDAKLMNAVHAVTDGKEALDFLHQRGAYGDAPQPDLILLEPQLPGTSGMEVLSELKNEPPLDEIRVIVLTSSEMGEEIVRSHGLEADEYIRKPVETEEFIDFVREVEDFWFAIVKNESDD
ncbi:response regulator receiver protein [Haloterrigena turkmenica DSM 5511]|uniref:Response regulator receiver protein n=1 Tax=Haloterrigena turkmenica (strain ATCC 51198 / DSM 5511 / JCM 9101 / NCIMB 13204 / VKM B-1734 / 4k) TaxID=543526 RepID=D2RVQ8_HALTV|nr:response regulator [Haloterrigena turkmenica]ADB59422.1 response regulator receiver protein [Haloterrigena turkmenica DSM 5511]